MSNDEIVLGYEREKGQYVVVEKDEVKDFKGKAEKAIHIDTFVAPDAIDPMQFEGRVYYLLPDGPIGTKAVCRSAAGTGGQRLSRHRSGCAVSAASGWWRSGR